MRLSEIIAAMKVAGFDLLIIEQPEYTPVFGTSASKLNDDGMTALDQVQARELRRYGLRKFESHLTPVDTIVTTPPAVIIPPSRMRSVLAT